MNTDNAMPAQQAMTEVCLYFKRADLVFESVVENSNFNYLYRFTHDEYSYYLKIILPHSKVQEAKLPADRLLGEARGITLFNLANEGHGVAEAPRLIKVLTEVNALILSDISDLRHNLANIGARNIHFFYNNIPDLAESVARFHKQTSEYDNHQDFGYEDELRTFIFERLIFPGIKKVCTTGTEKVLESILEPMKNNRECLVHHDLWAKNIFFSKVKHVALIDFEGCIGGDPAFDLATIFAMTVFPVYLSGMPSDDWQIMVRDIMSRYSVTLNDVTWFSKIESRLVSYVAVLLACRLEGPFSYSMPQQVRKHITAICCGVVDGEILNIDGLIEQIGIYREK